MLNLVLQKPGIYLHMHIGVNVVVVWGGSLHRGVDNLDRVGLRVIVCMPIWLHKQLDVPPPTE